MYHISDAIVPTLCLSLEQYFPKPEFLRPAVSLSKSGSRVPGPGSRFQRFQ
jgi:hypothetical protein